MATVDLFAKIVESTPAHFDQDHLKIIVYNNPQIPSRIEAILNGAESPSHELIRSAQFLEQSGADILVMPCNTAHYWYPDIQQSIHVKLIHMIDHTAEYLLSKRKGGQVMLLATAATVQAGLYQTAFAARDLSLQLPGSEEQHIVSCAIEQAKAGKIQENPYLKGLADLIAVYRQSGVDAFIAGCTEIPLLFDQLPGDFCRIDPTRLLAQEVVQQALQEKRITARFQSS